MDSQLNKIQVTSVWHIDATIQCKLAKNNFVVECDINNSHFTIGNKGALPIIDIITKNL